jgi:hypothetical protein
MTSATLRREQSQFLQRRVFKIRDTMGNVQHNVGIISQSVSQSVSQTFGNSLVLPIGVLGIHLY